MKAKAQLAIGILSLIALLIYTLAHTGSLLSQYVRPTIIGYIAAFGIEAAIVSLSLRIGELRKSQQSATFFYFVLVATVVTSAVANVAEGFYTLYGQHLTISSVSQLDFVQAGIGVTATGLISLIVLALSEIVGTDVATTVKLMEREKAQKVSLTTSTPAFEPTPEAAERARQVKSVQDVENKGQRHEAIVTALARKHNINITGLATMTGVSRQTIYRDINELVAGGIISKNGEGYKVS